MRKLLLKNNNISKIIFLNFFIKNLDKLTFLKILATKKFKTIEKKNQKANYLPQNSSTYKTIWQSRYPNFLSLVFVKV